jgi:hypothetical protein
MTEYGLPGGDGNFLPSLSKKSSAYSPFKPIVFKPIVAAPSFDWQPLHPDLVLSIESVDKSIEENALICAECGRNLQH